MSWFNFYNLSVVQLSKSLKYSHNLWPTHLSKCMLTSRRHAFGWALPSLLTPSRCPKEMRTPRRRHWGKKLGSVLCSPIRRWLSLPFPPLSLPRPACPSGLFTTLAAGQWRRCYRCPDSLPTVYTVSVIMFSQLTISLEPLSALTADEGANIWVNSHGVNVQ